MELCYLKLSIKVLRHFKQLLLRFQDVLCDDWINELIINLDKY